MNGRGSPEDSHMGGEEGFWLDGGKGHMFVSYQNNYLQ